MSENQGLFLVLVSENIIDAKCIGMYVIYKAT